MCVDKRDETRDEKKSFIIMYTVCTREGKN